VEREDLRDVQFGGLNNSRKVSFLTYGSVEEGFKKRPVGCRGRLAGGLAVGD